MNRKLDKHHDIFVLPSKDAYIIYAPLIGRILQVNAKCVYQLREYLRTGNVQCVDQDIISVLGGLDWLHGSIAPIPLPVDWHLHPCGVTLFLTNRCNLRCTDCYADAGAFKPKVMPDTIYQADIDFVFKNASRAGYGINISFHGGGEPTMVWDTLVGAMAYAKAIQQKYNNPPLEFGIATNGVMSEEKAEFVANEFPMVTLSFDGPEPVQNALRPKANGQGSYRAVRKFIDILKEHNTQFTLRSTITGANVGLMPDKVDFFVDEVGAKSLHFEPVFFADRCQEMGSGVPFPQAICR